MEQGTYFVCTRECVYVQWTWGDCVCMYIYIHICLVRVQPPTSSFLAHRFLNYLDLLKAWPEKCSIHATDSTRALVIAFEKVLMQQYTQRMKVPPKLLAQTILKYQEDILYDMSVAAAQTTRKA